jgi:MarR family transcriptional regulator, organic hydroperoxide resistance regulator
MRHPSDLRDPLSGIEGLDPTSAAVFGAFMRARRLHHQLMQRVLAEQDTPPGQAICLRILATNEGATQREVGDLLHLSAPTVTSMLKRMERSGTIDREPDPVDQRVTRVRLSPAGRELEHRLSTVIATRVGQLLETMPVDDRRTLARLLRDLADRMAAAIDEPATPATAPAAGGPRTEAAP